MAAQKANPISCADKQLIEAAREGCEESRLMLSRRSAMGLTASLFTSAILPRYATAATDGEARFLLVILRGGMDGLNAVVPKLDPLYSTVRGKLALPLASTLALNPSFGLHPALKNVHGMYLAGDAAVIPAAGIPVRSRSHFECQDNLENGLPANTTNATGWLNRFLGILPAGDPIRTKRGISIGPSALILRGPEPVLGWSPTWFDKSRPANLVRLRTLYLALDPALWSALGRGVVADNLATAAGAGPGGSLSTLRKAFIGAGKLLSAAAGPRIAVVSVDNWDMHSNEGALTGDLNSRLLELDQGLADFKAAVGTKWPKTVAICVTEFGRTIIANGSGGTDHGIGSAAFLVGGAVKSRVVGDWPGLAPAQRFDGDLRPTVDLRAVFKGILRDHLGAPASLLETTVFPGSAAAPPIANLVDTPVPASVAAMQSAPTGTPPVFTDSPILRYRREFGMN